LRPLFFTTFSRSDPLLKVEPPADARAAQGKMSAKLTRSPAQVRQAGLEYQREMTMGKREIYEQKAEELILPIIDANGFELVDVEYVKEGQDMYLRAYIDKEGGITIDDCETVSRAFSDKLDEADLIPDAYILEVSSPGLGRPLKKEKDYKRSLGKDVEIRTYKSIDGEKEFTGILKSYDADTVTIENEDGTETVFNKKDISLIRLAIIW